METKTPQPYSSPEMKSGITNSPDIQLPSRIESSKPETNEIIDNSALPGELTQSSSIVKTLPVPIKKMEHVYDKNHDETAKNPPVAKDIEHIEKEWVMKAKQIIAQTKDDPYLQEKEISKLQADYLKKRCGREVKTTGE